MHIPHLDHINKTSEDHYIIQGTFGDVLLFKSEDLYILIKNGEHILIHSEWITQYTPYLAKLIKRPAFASIPKVPEEMIKTLVHGFSNNIPRYFVPIDNLMVKAAHSVVLAGNKSIFLLVNHYKVTLNISVDYRVNIQAPDIYSTHGDEWKYIIRMMQTIRWRLKQCHDVFEHITTLEDMEWFIVHLINNYESCVADVSDIISALSLSIPLSDWNCNSSVPDEVDILV